MSDVINLMTKEQELNDKKEKKEVWYYYVEKLSLKKKIRMYAFKNKEIGS